MSVPEQVLKQTEAVQKLYENLEAGDAPSPENGEEDAGVQGDPEQLDPAAADSADESAVPSEDDEQSDDGQDGDWEQKYRSLQGMYNADVPRLNAQNQELTERITSLEQLIATMQDAPAVATPDPVAPPANTLTPEEQEEYGESIDIMRKVSQEVASVFQGRIDALEATISQMQGTVIPRVEEIATHQAQTAEQIFWSALQEQAPDWHTVNENQDFQSWLLEIDALSGRTRQSFLEEAQQQLDATRVAGFFNTWQKESGAVTAQPNRSDTDTELGQQIAPGRGRSSDLPTGGEQKTYSSQDITDFFRSVREGGFVGRESERDTIERDIFAAQREGRIVNA